MAIGPDHGRRLWRLDNTFTAYYARLMLDRHPEWQGRIETRSLASGAPKTGPCRLVTSPGPRRRGVTKTKPEPRPPAKAGPGLTNWKEV